MAEQSPLRAVEPTSAPSSGPGIVHPLSRAPRRPCARPGCRAPAMAALSFRYESREAWLSPLGEQPSPATYDLCAEHAARTRPPHGWQLRDQRPAPEAPAGDTPRDEPDTVTVLAAALRALPTPAAEW